MDGHGYDQHSWDRLKVVTGGCATRAEVDTAAAIFALGDTVNGRPLGWTLPQPVIWTEDEEDFAAVVVQAEVHETEGGETLEVLGLVLPTGKTAVAFTEDVEVVEASDPVWISLVEAELEDDEDDPEADEADDED